SNVANQDIAIDKAGNVQSNLITVNGSNVSFPVSQFAMLTAGSDGRITIASPAQHQGQELTIYYNADGSKALSFGGSDGPATTITAGTLQGVTAAVLRSSLSTADAASEIGRLGAGSDTLEHYLSTILASARASSSVATLAYEFFTGKAPSAAGMDYLVSPTG